MKIARELQIHRGFLSFISSFLFLHLLFRKQEYRSPVIWANKPRLQIVDLRNYSSILERRLY